VKIKYSKIKIAALFVPVLLGIKTNAQLKGDHLVGDFGLSAGTQAPPTIIAALPLYGYNASRLKNSDGDVVDRSPDIGAFLLGVGGSVVTNLKILNANYGASILVAFISNRIEGNIIQSKSSLGFTDMYAQPLQLGWHTKRADFSAGYGIYIPVGKYEYGGTDNKGLGMWGHEFSGGATVYLDQKKTFNISSILFYELHSEKKNTSVKVGDILTAEGGLGKTFYKPIKGFPIPVVFNAGLIYYVQYKATNDEIPVGTTVFTGTKDHIYAAGLEFNVLHPKIGTSIGLRWLDEFSAKNRFEGNTFLITIGYIIKSLEKKEEKNEN
jgi:hypothetical protein